MSFYILNFFLLDFDYVLSASPVSNGWCGWVKNKIYDLLQTPYSHPYTFHAIFTPKGDWDHLGIENSALSMSKKHEFH